jgi:cell filamentation protein
MRMGANRYEAQGTEADFEPGSHRRVLRNLLGIRSVREMQRVESDALLVGTERLIDETTEDKRFTANDVRHFHRAWLGEIYPWAGAYRNVNISKGGFPFAPAAQIPRLMEVFSRGPLRRFTPCNSILIQEQEEALAVVHAELILIHPFREGNGRCARVLSTLMALQADLPPLDFSGVRGREKQRYIAAIHAALDRNYEPMKQVMGRIIERTFRSYTRNARR